MNQKERVFKLYKKPWVVKAILIFAVAVVYFAIILICQPRVIKDKNNNMEEFSAERAFKHIEQIAQKPHYHTDREYDATIYQNLLEVRAYIQTTLSDMGVVPIVRNYPIGTEYSAYIFHKDIDGSIEYFWDELELEYEIENYVVEFKGKNDTAILLSAHYDSVPPNYWPFVYEPDGSKNQEAKGVSMGAADDGYGVGTILEICRLLKTRSEAGQLENTVKLLINDGEEVGYQGVKMELQKQADYYKDVSFVVNLEARGTSGNAIMFETVKYNSRIIELYNKGKNKFANSLSTFVTSQMFDGGSYTDFGRFVEDGFVGIGFSNVKQFDDYHSKHDNLQNVSLRTIQQLGNQAYPVVLEFAENPKYSDVNYFKSGDETVFFVVLPNLLIKMNFTVQIAVVSIILLAMGFLVFLQIRKKRISVAKTLISLVGILLVVLLASGIALFYTFICSLITNVKFEFINMYGVGSGGYILSSLIVIFIFATMMFLLTKNGIKKHQGELQAAISILLMIASIITLIVLPHGVHIFSILLFYCLWFFVKDFIKSQKAKIITTPFVILLISLFYLPLLTELYYSIAFGGFAIVMAVAVLPLIVTAFLLSDETGNTSLLSVETGNTLLLSDETVRDT